MHISNIISKIVFEEESLNSIKIFELIKHDLLHSLHTLIKLIIYFSGYNFLNKII